jgi:hypothetical protein
MVVLAVVASTSIPGAAQRVPARPRAVQAGPTLTLPLPGQPPFDDDTACPSNRLANGGLDRLTGNPAVTASGTPVGMATSWSSAWQGPPTAMVFAHQTASPAMAIPGNFLMVPITNPNPDMQQYGALRGGALGQLAVPITVNSGTFTLTFRTAEISGVSNSYPATQVAIYAIHRSGSAALPPLVVNAATPANGALYGPGSARLIGQVAIPVTAGRNWVAQSISFNSALLATADDGQPMGSMTHILITGGVGAVLPPSLRRMGFDGLCLRNPLT